MTELIFIEGVSGIGKSTMVRALAEELRAAGHRVQAYVEFDFTNPIDFYCTAYLTADEYNALCRAYPDDKDTIRKYTIPAGEVCLVRYYNEDTPLFEKPLRDELVRHEFCYHPSHLVSLENYTAAYRHVWENFAGGIDDSLDYILFDGSLLHHPINDMMRNYHVTGEQAVPHVTTLLHALGSRKRRIFYLETDDIRTQLTRAHLDRKQAVPTDEEVDFWETRHRNDRTVLAALDEECTIYDVSAGNRDDIRERIRKSLTDNTISLSDFVGRTPIDKGWSGDKKYCAETTDGTKYLLRTSEPGSYGQKKEEFDAMREVERLGIPMCRPVSLGETDEFVYSVQTWIDGEDAEEVIASYSASDQYAFGLTAGRILAKIHSIPAPETQEEWESRFNRKIDRKIKDYHDCPLKFDGAEHMLRYLEENRHLLHGRPQSFQHGDYHIGNMMIDKNGVLTVIDFNRFDYGDPWEEFNRIVWCAQTSPLFASGMVNGYFDGDVPMEFWRLLALYISSNTLSSVYWAIPFGQQEIDTMMNQAREILEWYDNMTKPVPAWYCAEVSDA